MAMSRKTKLELTWIGKDERPKLEPRILIEDPALSHHAASRRDGDIFDNMLIRGDNLLALKALEAHRFQPMLSDATRGYYNYVAEHDGGRYGELVKRFLADPNDRQSADKLGANDPGYTRTRCVATMLTAGHAPNAMAQRAEATVNCRIFPGVPVEAVRAECADGPMAGASGESIRELDRAADLLVLLSHETDPAAARDCAHILWQLSVMDRENCA